MPDEPTSAHPPSRNLRNVSAGEMTSTVARAAELLTRDEGRPNDLDRRAALAAADELGIPQTYLEQAAAELHAERVASERRRRVRNRLIGGAVAVALLAAGVVAVNRLTGAPPEPVVYTFDQASATTWRLDTNAESQASVSFPEEASKGRVAVVRVERFGPAGAGATYFVNLNSADGPKQLDGYEALTFQVRGEGLGRVRLYLEAGEQRWRSPEVTVSGEWRNVRLSLAQFERQTRNQSGDGWRTTSYQAPNRIERLSFKLGTFINDDPNQGGEVRINDVRIE